MSKPSNRPNREAIKNKRKERKKAQKELRISQQEQGLEPKSHASYSNSTSVYDTVEQEHEGRLEAVSEQVRIIKSLFPRLLKQLSKIPDPRNPKKIKYSMTLLMIYGILMFVFQISSRRQVNKKMTQPQFKENLNLMFPELVDLPHSDTLFRLLSSIDVDEIEASLISLIKQLIDKKKFRRFLINNCYPIAIDGTQKMPFNDLWCEQLLQRKKKKKKDKKENKSSSSIDGDDKTELEGEEQDYYQYYVYVLEANLSFHNGMVFPLLSEFLEYEQGDMENNKQDCEQRAFKRLAKRLKQYFPNLAIILLLDGLYANGPIMEECEKYHWQFMIVLKEDQLSSVWEEYYSLLKLSSDNHYEMNWGTRHQQFKWVNNIEYYYGTNNCNHITIHVTTCDEQWETINKEGEKVTMQSHHAWISSRPLTRNNLHERCNLGARYRWGIEANFLVEKHQGYHYEHCFALDWQAMKGYHYLMRLGHLFNTLARFSSTLNKFFKQLGVQGFISFIYNTFTGPWLNAKEVNARLIKPFRLSFNTR